MYHTYIDSLSTFYQLPIYSIAQLKLDTCLSLRLDLFLSVVTSWLRMYEHVSDNLRMSDDTCEDAKLLKWSLTV